MSLKMILRNIFSYSKNSVLDFNVFYSRSVLVLNVKNFSCSCSVLVREQEQVREHVLEQLACSFIPDINHISIIPWDFSRFFIVP